MGEVVSQTETVTICPQCGASNGMTLASGQRLCFECRHEWSPDDAPTLHAVGESVAVRAVDLVLGPPAEVLEARDAQARLDAIIGREVELEGGQTATVHGFPDDDHVEVILLGDEGSDIFTIVDLGDVVRELPPPAEVLDVPDETGILLAKGAFMVAGLALNAGLATLEGDGADYRLVMPPNGWAPDDPDALPLFEQGIAYAIATLIFSYQLPRDIVAAMAQTLLTDAQTTPDV
jgi:hypothetical protein